MSESETREQDAEPAPAQCRALTVVTRSAPALHDERPLAGFVAQLIACRGRLPAYRRAGRAEPAAARQSYARVPAQHARRFDLVV